MNFIMKKIKTIDENSKKNLSWNKLTDEKKSKKMMKKKRKFEQNDKNKKLKWRSIDFLNCFFQFERWTIDDILISTIFQWIVVDEKE